MAAAVRQKNTGKSYVSSVCTSAGLSPGKHAEDHAHTQSVAAKRQLDFKSTKTSKRRRNELNSRRSSKQGVAELREGTTYSTGKDISGFVTLVDILQYFSMHIESIVQFGYCLTIFYPEHKIFDNGKGLVMNPFLLHSTGTGCTLSDLNSEASVEIPPPWIEPAASSALSSSVSVAFDLETTGLGPLSSMTPISAAACGTDKAFQGVF